MGVVPFLIHFYATFALVDRSDAIIHRYYFDGTRYPVRALRRIVRRVSVREKNENPSDHRRKVNIWPDRIFENRAYTS